MVSVIMPTYNSNENMLADAINSILNQSYKDFELIIIDDGSKDYCNYEYIISNFKDSRIKVYKNTKNSGVAFSLNAAIEKSSGKYIVRMDSDDIAESNRIETLVEYMESHPDISILGSFAQTFGADKKKLKYPETDLDIRVELLYNNAFCHPTVIFKKEIIEKYGLKYSTNVSNEDFDFWVNASKHKEIKFANIPLYLLKYRVHSGQVTKTKFEKLKMDSKSVIRKSLTNYNLEIDEDVLNKYINTIYNYRKISVDEYNGFLHVFNAIADELEDEQALKHLSKKYKAVIVKQALYYHNILNVSTKFSCPTDNKILDYSYCIISIVSRFKRGSNDGKEN